MAARFKARAGVDLGGTKIQAVVVDARNAVRGSARAPTPGEGGPEAVAAAIVDTVRAAVSEAGDPVLSGSGVGSPGEVSATTGVVSQAKNLPGWDGSFPLGPVMSEALGGVRVVLGNDVDVAVRAEFELGAGKPFSSVVGAWWGTGVGGGLILDGRPWTGRGSAAEIGHVVIRVDGRRCPCGRRGCMEAYAGRGSMEARARKLVAQGRETKLFSIMEERGRDRLTSGVWERALRHGDELAHELVDEAVEALGAGVASVCNVIDPEAVLLGGGMGVRFGSDYADRIAAAMLPHLFVSDRPPPVKVAGLGDLGGAIGAALLVR